MPKPSLNSCGVYAGIVPGNGVAKGRADGNAQRGSDRTVDGHDTRDLQLHIKGATPLRQVPGARVRE